MKSLNTKLVTPKKVPIRCPVCSGFGTVNWGKKKCHGCEGKGWILVEAKEERDGDKRY